ncbi:hypothetical protein P154DRAFT_524495 [Amniculicola lignicola CBS 123094]|uniref:tRNA wybutosine-synthesizing protein 3 n=1 Tax=Amniculicola lignicola CBS 123094 TaxID=1392246 RepID=A0A6A5WJV3_9PLEO|nr:hypothetical protein P154DRAFT_524495 [Amniculicola lignicola CBS 123094]
MPTRFELKKQRILEQLETPEEEYSDLSPKGSVDEPIRPLIAEINQLQGLVTTSSCSGRISVFLEGKKRDNDPEASNQADEPSRAGPGGKGGGSWLFISHSPVEAGGKDRNTSLMSTFNLSEGNGDAKSSPQSQCSYIHIKFEPMILHILTASLEDAQHVITAAMDSGFRESGALSLGASKARESNPMVAVRSTGYSFDAIVGFQDEHNRNVALVDETYLQILVGIANERFKVNSERIARFRASLLHQYTVVSESASSNAKQGWENADARKQRKREEGFARQRALQDQSVALDADTTFDGTNIDGAFG